MSFKNEEEINKKYNTGGDWLSLKEGANRVRVMSDCVDYGSHYSIGKSVICIGKEHCVLCKKGLEPKVQFLSWVIDRADGKIKLFRFGYKIYKQLMAYKKSEDYAFDELPAYDITVNRVGTGKNSEYTVVPARKNTEITDAEKDLFMKKYKDPNEIIDGMKAKVVFTENEPEEGEEEEIDTE